MPLDSCESELARSPRQIPDTLVNGPDLKLSPEVIVAAGGLVWRDLRDRQELLIVRRDRHQKNEWTLPKGKAEPGESWLATAQREVAEEAGCEVEIGPFAGCNSYLARGYPKIVLLWNMKYLREVSPDTSDEIQERRWVKVEEALRLLSHLTERTLMQVNRFV